MLMCYLLILIFFLNCLGQLGGSVATGILSGKFGRRYTIMMLCLPLAIGWAIIGFSKVPLRSVNHHKMLSCVYKKYVKMSKIKILMLKMSILTFC